MLCFLENESFIFYNLFNTIHYDEHFGAFNVILTSKLKFVKLNELDNSFPVHHISISDGTIFIKINSFRHSYLINSKLVVTILFFFVMSYNYVQTTTRIVQITELKKYQ
ncbi:C2H2-type domain-containing protein [Aphis craccivora]|uniref:C2H2-type domain-containing protein n=1 Tax=Aphis craccivora TaxID=307492 RepID=A0A6G0Y4W6_APHCR|nr:C2H2-type domain-containing protein [Aphis craccivora]